MAAAPTPKAAPAPPTRPRRHSHRPAARAADANKSQLWKAYRARLGAAANISTRHDPSVAAPSASVATTAAADRTAAFHQKYEWSDATGSAVRYISVPVRVGYSTNSST